MTGPLADYFVGGVSAVMGVGMLLSTLLNWDRMLEFRKVRWTQERLGRAAARLLFGVLGVALIALGVAIAMGFAPNAGR